MEREDIESMKGWLEVLESAERILSMRRGSSGGATRGEGSEARRGEGKRRASGP